MTMAPIRATYVDAFGIEHPLNSAAIVEARKNSPDWQAAQNVATSLQMGQVALNVENATTLVPAMKPENRDRLLDLVRRYRDLTIDATALVDEIDRDLQKSI
jgi:hypothetical protein